MGFFGTTISSKLVVFILIFLLSRNDLFAQVPARYNGDWTCVESYSPALGTEDAYYEDGLIHHYCADNIRIEGNRLHYFELPCEHKFSATMEDREGKFYYANVDDQIMQGNYMSMVNDTLVIESGFGPQITVSRFIRDTFNNKMISTLMKEGIDPQCLKGTWILDKEYNSGYDGYGSVRYEFPFELKDTLVFDSLTIQQCWLGKRKILTPTGKQFYVLHISAIRGWFILKATFRHKKIIDNFNEGYFGNDQPEYNLVIE